MLLVSSAWTAQSVFRFDASGITWLVRILGDDKFSVRILFPSGESAVFALSGIDSVIQSIEEPLRLELDEELVILLADMMYSRGKAFKRALEVID